MHADMLAAFGGSQGIRDRAGLESAVHAPRNVHYYEGGGVFDVAAAYAFHIAQAQCFVDGNKRTGLAACLGFLDANGVPYVVPGVPDVFAGPIEGFATKTVTRSDFAELLHNLSNEAEG